MEALLYFAIFNFIAHIADTIALSTGLATLIYFAIEIAKFFQNSIRSKNRVT